MSERHNTALACGCGRVGHEVGHHRGGAENDGGRKERPGGRRAVRLAQREAERHARGANGHVIPLGSVLPFGRFQCAHALPAPPLRA